MNIQKYIITIFFLLISSMTAVSHTPKVIFSHGIVDSFKQAFWYAKAYTYDNVTYQNERYLFSNFVTFNYPDAFDKFYNNPFWFRETSLGQENELHRLNSVYTKVTKHTDDIILFGLSRGASAVLNFAGTYNPSYVKAIVVESPYDSAATMIDSVMNKCNLSYLPHAWGEYTAESIFRKYNRNGIHPCNMLCNISKNIPILIICSQEDSLVPFTSSYEIYKKLRELGHQYVHIFITNYGKHAKILSGVDGKNIKQSHMLSSKGTIFHTTLP